MTIRKVLTPMLSIVIIACYIRAIVCVIKILV